MSALAQRTDALRSHKYLDGARGEVCKLRFVGICGGGTETTVACHVHDQSFGMGRKAHDISTIDGCAACHAFLDHGWVGKISRTILLEHIIRGMQETLLNRVARGIVFVPVDLPARDRPTKLRKPPAERAKVAAGRPLQSRTEWPEGRKIQQRAKP